MAKNPMQPVLTISTSHSGSLIFKAFACGIMRNHPILAAKSRSTREDPFENVWNEVRSWLENDPEKTATLMLLKLKKKYPGQYFKGQLRKLQRRVNVWREKVIITYDDNLLQRNPSRDIGAKRLIIILTEQIIYFSFACMQTNNGIDN